MGRSRLFARQQEAALEAVRRQGPPPRVAQRSSFREYLDQTWPARWDRAVVHLALIAAWIEQVEAGRLDRLMINMPPRHGKSETATIRGAAWMFERHPDQNYLITANTDTLARRFSRKARNIARRRIALAADSASIAEWSSPEGGSFVARGVGSPPVGIGFRGIFIDDPIKNREQAESPRYRERAWDWYTDDLLNRLEPGGAIVMTNTRWHSDDVSARALASEPGAWYVLRLPAICDEEDDELGREIGAALWPERYDVAALERIRSVMAQNEGEYGWLSLYQQRPTPRVGAFFDQTRLDAVGYVEEPLVRVCRAWDLAATTDGDWTAGVKMGIGESGRLYVLNVVRQRATPDLRDRLMLQTADADGLECPIWFPTDPSASGKVEALRIMRLLSGYTLRTATVTGAKVTRASGLASQVNGGNVSIVRGAWNSEFLEELRTFPLGKNDDQVDAAADAFRNVTGKRKLTLL